MCMRSSRITLRLLNFRVELVTVALGLVCRDGVLVASDSMATGEGFASKSIKVRRFDRIPAIWTAAGSVFTMEEVQLVLDREDAAGTADGPPGAYLTPDLAPIRQRLHGPINRAMRGAYDKCLSAGPPVDGRVALPFAASFLILGYSAETPWFLEFAGDGQVNWHTESGFYAVGSGGPFATLAHASMEHYITDDLSLSDGKKLAYRAIETTINSSHFGVAGPVQMAVCDGSGPRILSDEEMNLLSVEVDTWKTLERESLKLVGAPEAFDDDEMPTLGE